MAIYKQPKSEYWWFKFVWDGKPIRESTKQTNRRVAEQMEAARRTQLAKGEVGIRDIARVPTIAEGGYPLDSGSPYRLWSGLGRMDDLIVWDGICSTACCARRKKSLPRFLTPPVEAERELIQVVVEVLVAHGPLVGAHQPPFEQRDCAVNARQQLRRRLFLPLQKSHVVMVAIALQGPISQPPVSVDDAAGFDRVPNKGDEVLGRSV